MPMRLRRRGYREEPKRLAAADAAATSYAIAPYVYFRYHNIIYVY